jgi:hypothetical protein
MCGKENSIESNGLCSTCKYQENCSLIITKDSPIHFCEEYYCLEIKSKQTNPLLQEKASKIIPEKDENKFKGLCKNCGNNKSCIHINKAIGVWHCNEYC